MDISMCGYQTWPFRGYIHGHFLARSAKLPEGLYILPMFFLYFIFFLFFFNGRLSSHRS